MISQLLRRLFKIGLKNTVPSFKFRQILITNYLALTCILVTLLTGVFLLMVSFTAYGIACLVGTFLYTFIFYFNAKGQDQIAKIYFLVLSTCLVVAVSVLSAFYSRDVGATYYFFPVLVIFLLLYNHQRRAFLYWSIFSLLLLTLVLRVEVQGAPYTTDFFVNCMNLTFAASLIYLSVSFFKKLLIRSVKKANEHEKTLYSLLDNVPIFMALVDRHGEYKIANQHYSELFGLDKEAIIGKKRSSVLPKGILDQHKPYFEKALNGESVSFLENDKMPNGDTVFSRGKYVPILNKQGEIEAISIYVDDVSELVEAEESLKKANETKNKLFSIIAHDIRSPLNLFQSVLNTSHDEIITKKQFLEYQEKVKAKLGTLSETVDELLDWARMQMGGINAYPSQVELHAVVKENVDLFWSVVLKKNIELVIDTPTEVTAWIDENHFKVAIRNLIHNALKYSNYRGKVSIRSTIEGDDTVIVISDTGVGMTAETVESIRRKELQKSKVGTDKESGTGLGLSLSLGLLEKNNAEVSVKSRLNKGTTFEIRIPSMEKSEEARFNEDLQSH